MSGDDQARMVGVLLAYLTVACIGLIVLVGTVAAIWAICTAVWG